MSPLSWCAGLAQLWVRSSVLQVGRLQRASGWASGVDTHGGRQVGDALEGLGSSEELSLGRVLAEGSLSKGLGQGSRSGSTNGLRAMASSRGCWGAKKGSGQ